MWSASLLLLQLAAAVQLPLGGLPAGQPDVAVGRDGTIVVVAVRDSHVVVARCAPGPAGAAGAFTEPMTLAADLRVPGGLRRAPRVAIARGSIVITTPVLEGGGFRDDIVALRSTDGGTTWSAPSRVNDKPGTAVQLLHDLTELADDSLAVAWLDERRAKDREELFLARSTSAGATWEKSERLYASPDGSVCECCPLSVAAGPYGVATVAFRNAFQGLRDPWLVTAGAGEKPAPMKLGSSSWAIQACPMAGNAVAYDRSGHWWAVASSEGELTLVTEGARVHPLGSGRNPAIAATAAELVVASRGPAGLEVRSIAVAGKERRISPPSRIAKRGDWPSLAALPDGRVALAYEEAGKVLLILVAP